MKRYIIEEVPNVGCSGCLFYYRRECIAGMLSEELGDCAKVGLDEPSIIFKLVKVEEIEK